MDIDEIKRKVASGQYGYSIHAQAERVTEGLGAEAIRTAVLNGQILEQYPDTGRGVSCLVVGFAEGLPIHVVCGWRDIYVQFITVYIPVPPYFVDPWTRGR